MDKMDKFELIGSTVTRVELKNLSQKEKNDFQEFIIGLGLSTNDNLYELICIDDVLKNLALLNLSNSEDALLYEICKEARTRGFTYLEFDFGSGR